MYFYLDSFFWYYKHLNTYSEYEFQKYWKALQMQFAIYQERV